ncbi:UNVERIFIED_ORG: hypothetical protein DFS12_106229 [Chitinophaga ginsengisegetis]|nr:hypothetical protein [Chitinophaga ginsengisegetis]MDR6649350.1 hypothetical protein [Chitinophaga ginsengisegetis]MDR6655700.1 hypothetical protein [Chitinophaga ginsengisegetis]
MISGARSPYAHFYAISGSFKNSYLAVQTNANLYTFVVYTNKNR